MSKIPKWPLIDYIFHAVILPDYRSEVSPPFWKGTESKYFRPCHITVCGILSLIFLKPPSKSYEKIFCEICTETDHDLDLAWGPFDDFYYIWVLLHVRRVLIQVNSKLWPENICVGFILFGPSSLQEEFKSNNVGFCSLLSVSPT
jgi:hypothetical protein